jgi:hypothetical protein
MLDTGMKSSPGISRRRFVRKAAVSGVIGVAAPYFASAAALGGSGRPGANERLQIALIGAGSMGTANLKNCAQYDDVVVTGVCDVWKSRRDAVVEKYKEAGWVSTFTR